jgi:hypothetical protein
MANYRVLIGIDYPPDRRAEPGDVVSDIPAKSLKWLREQGVIELVDDATEPVLADADVPAVADDTTEVVDVIDALQDESEG